MNKLYKGYDDIEASAAFKQKLVQTLQNETKTAEPVKIASGVRMKRSTFIAVIAAAALVLAIGTAVAVGASTIGRLKEKTEAYVEQRQQMTEDERYREARAKAEEAYTAGEDGDHFIYYVRLAETATMQDVTVTLKDIAETGINDRDECILELRFSADSAQTGMVETFRPIYDLERASLAEVLSAYDSFCEICEDARSFRLSFNGKTYEADTCWKEDGSYSVSFEIPDYVMPDEVPFGIEMTLTGKLLRRDAQGGYTGEIGTFSIPFIYEYTDEMREADIEEYAQRLMHDQEIYDQRDADAVSAPLPEEATELNQTVGIITYHDVTADEQGILLGFTIDYRPIEHNTICYYETYCSIDGYTVPAEWVLDEYVYDPEVTSHRELLEITCVQRLPYYTARENIGDVVTVAYVNTLLLNDGSEELCPFVFRYNLKTGEVTLPKDDAERDAWYIPPMELDGNSPSSYEVISVMGVSETQNGVPVTVDEVAFDSWGLLHIYYHADNLACAELTENAETCPKEYRINDTFAVQYWWEEDAGGGWMTEFDVEDYVASGEIAKKHTAEGEWIVILPQPYESYDGPITIGIRDWTLYDLNEKGERVQVGTYNFTFTVDPKDAHTEKDAPRESNLYNW